MDNGCWRWSLCCVQVQIIFLKTHLFMTTNKAANKRLVKQAVCFFCCCSDTVCDLGGASELANYGEYSGAPSESQTYEYAKTIIRLMTNGPPRPDGKI